MSKKETTVESWLSDVYYDKFGQYLWNKVTQDGGSQMIGEVRGWGAIQKLFDTDEKCGEFQDKVGEFIAQAIREKVEKRLDNIIGEIDFELAMIEDYAHGDVGEAITKLRHKIANHYTKKNTNNL